MRFWGILVLGLVVCCISAQTALFDNINVLKQVDLTNAIVKVSIRYTVKSASSEQNKYVVAIPKRDHEHMAYITAEDSRKTKLSIKKSDVQDA